MVLDSVTGMLAATPGISPYSVKTCYYKTRLQESPWYRSIEVKDLLHPVVEWFRAEAERKVRD